MARLPTDIADRGAPGFASRLVLSSRVTGPTPLNLQLWPGAVAKTFIAILTAALVADSGRPGLSAYWC